MEQQVSEVWGPIDAIATPSNSASVAPSAANNCQKQRTVLELVKVTMLTFPA